MSKGLRNIITMGVAVSLALVMALPGGALAETSAEPACVSTWAELAEAAADGQTEIVVTADITRADAEETVVFSTAVALQSAEGKSYTIDGNGGQGICIQGTDADTPLEGLSVVKDLTFQNCDAQAAYADLHASGAGGALFVQGDLRVGNCVFVNNTANIGGAICTDGGSLTMVNCTLTGNEGVTGGGVCAYSGDMALENCVFTENTAEYYGGGAYVYTGDLQVSGCTFTENETQYGGGVCAYNGAVTVADSIFTDNSAAYCGGGLYTDQCTVTIATATMQNNDSNYGACVCVYGGALTVSGGSFTDNEAGFAGGALYGRENTVTVTGGEISHNTAMYGGGVYLLNARAELTGGTITGNEATQNGGGVYMKEDSTTVDTADVATGNTPNDIKKSEMDD